VTAIGSLEDMQQRMLKAIGRRIDITHPDEFAEIAYQALLEDKYWIMPIEDRVAAAIRDRYEGMLAGRTPKHPDIL